MVASRWNLRATLPAASSWSFDPRSVAPSVRGAPAFADGHSLASDAVSRLEPPAGFDGDITIWRLIHGAGNPDDDAVDCLTSQDSVEFTRLGAEARCRASAVRSLLRRTLSVAVNNEVSPAAWRFTRTAYGKPHVVEGLPVVHFSTTHTRGASLIATSRHTSMGIDAEASGFAGWRVVAEDMFTRRERAMLNSAPEHTREETFLRIWTAKEAHAKLIGTGLRFDVAVNDCGPGTHFATWLDKGPSARVVVTLAVNHAAKRHRNGEGGTKA